MTLYINGMKTAEDVIEMIKDNIDSGNLDDAKDYLNQFKEYLGEKIVDPYTGGMFI
tara:strand:- start:19 stop:186 length:168 start_codon:yes stop_codon:yes gene_type:complete